MQEVKTAIIPVAGVATRFLPLSKAITKELWPLVDQPLIYYALNDLKESGIKNIVFVVGPKNRAVLEYFKPSPNLEKLLKERKKTNILSDLKKFEEFASSFTFSYVIQKAPLGDGHAILQAAKFASQEPVVCLFPDDIIVEGKEPCFSQLIKVFKTCERPIVGIYRAPKEKLSWYGVPKVEKIANRLYKLKEIIEKPEPGKAPSDFAFPSRYVLTPEVFDYLKKTKPTPKGEILLADTLGDMLKDGKLVYGYEFEGKWLECGNKQEWIKSFVYLCLKHPQFGPELRNFLKTLKI